MFLFLTGLVISLFTIHHTIARIILAATVVGGCVYMAITVMPVIYHNSPYQSPLSGLVWEVPRRMAKALLSAAHHIVSLQKHTGFIRNDYISSLSARIMKCKKRLSLSMVKAAEDAAQKQDWSIDARALKWTLGKSDEESGLEKFVAGISKFARSRAVEDPLGVLKAAIRPTLYRDITTLLINASDRDLLPNYKELPESVRQWRIEICSEALYFVPQAIEKILRRVSKMLDDPKVRRGFASVLESELSWNMAIGYSESVDRKRYKRLNKSFFIAARCMATVMATRLPNTMSESILKRQFGIQDPDILRRYLASSDSFLLKNLNHFLENTVLKSDFIHVETSDILVSTVRIAKRLQFNSAAQELRVKFEEHFMSIARLAYSPRVSEAIRKNARELLSELVSLRNSGRATGNGSPPTPLAPTDATTATPPDNDSSVAMASPIQSPSPQVSSPLPGDIYIDMQPYLETPSGETHPLMPTPSLQAYPEPPHSATLSTMAPDIDGSVAMVSPIQSPSPQVSSPPPGDVYIEMQPYPETPSGETHPLMTTPSLQAYPEPPHSATLPTMPMPSGDTSSGDEESAE
jgi:hypothetical protein